MAIVILVVAWGTNPAGAVSGEYQRSLAAYNQATAEVEAAQAKQKQAAALLALNQAKDQSQRRVVQSANHGAGIGDFSDTLRQIQQRWGQTRIPGSTVTFTSPTGDTANTTGANPTPVTRTPQRVDR